MTTYLRPPIGGLAFVCETEKVIVDYTFHLVYHAQKVTVLTQKMWIQRALSKLSQADCKRLTLHAVGKQIHAYVFEVTLSFSHLRRVPSVQCATDQT